MEPNPRDPTEPAQPPDLQDEVVFITGASQGLGRALAHGFADAGAKLVLCARGAEKLAAVKDEIPGSNVVTGAVDVTDAAAVAALVERAADRVGTITVLVNNAAILGDRSRLRDHSIDVWRAVLDINLTGTLIPTQAVLPGMRAAGRGSIINVSSGVGNTTRKRWGAYAISKWGVEALSNNLALEEEDAGIRVNIVDPGSLQTDMRQAAFPDENPLDPAPPRDAVPVFLWLASRHSRVTGERFRAQEWRE